MPDNEKFALPETLPTDPGELEALEEAAVAAFQERHARGATSAEDVAELQALADAVSAVRAARASDAGGEGDGEEPGEPEGPTEQPEPAEPEAAPDEAPAEAPADPGAAVALLDRMVQPAAAPAPSAPAGDVPAASIDALAAAIQALVASAAEKPAAPARAAVQEAPPDTQLPVTPPHRATIVASADVPGVPSSSVLDGLDGLVAALGAKARSIGVQRLGSSNRGYPVATIEKPLDPQRNLDGLSESDQLQRQGDLSSVEYLVASGGWCAPSEQLYDLACEVEAPPDMVVLPTFSTARGGVKFPISPTYADFMSLENNGLFTWTEQDDIDAGESDGPTKPCFHIPCIDFDEARLELEGLCMTAGNLMDKAYPELVRRTLSLGLNGHLHRMNTQKILKMLAFVDDTVGMPATFAAASAVYDALSLQVADLRDAYSMSEGAVVEGMAPRWLRGPLKVDVARREQTDLSTVSNADVDRYLADAGMRIQFVSDWQPMGDPLNPATQWPTEVQILLWLPGALRELTGPSLNINTARDSILNSTNDYSVVFTEESYQIYKPGCGVRLVEIPICPNGAIGERVELLCAGESA